MSRSGYSDDCDNQWSLICYRGAVNSAIKGARGQAFLKELIATLDAMPVKELVADELDDGQGNVCAIGSVGKARGVDMTNLDPENSAQVAKTFNISDTLAREIVFINDDDFAYRDETPAQRWERVRKWAFEHLNENQPPRPPTFPLFYRWEKVKGGMSKWRAAYFREERYRTNRLEYEQKHSKNLEWSFTKPGDMP